MRRCLARACAAVAGATLLTGCSNDGRGAAANGDGQTAGTGEDGAGERPAEPAPSANVVESGLVGQWRLESIRTEPVDLADAERAPTLGVTPSGEVGGFGGVNRWGSQLEAEALPRGEFRLAPIASTLMAGPREAMALEKRYMDALRAAAAYDAGAVAGGGLVLRDDAGVELLRFTRE